MAVPVTPARMYDLVISELSRVPRETIAQLAVLSLVSHAVGLAVWFLRSPADPVLLGLSILTALAGLAVAYVASMKMIDEPASRRGFGLYIGVALVMTLPPLAGIGLIMMSALTGQGLLMAVGFGVILISLVILPMLAAWPILQSVSPRLIGPVEAFRRSRGMRWPLLLVALISSGMSRALPETMQADTLSEALFSAGLNAAFGVAFTAVLIAVGVAAFRQMN